jgi:hypothetical protein
VRRSRCPSPIGSGSSCTTARSRSTLPKPAALWAQLTGAQWPPRLGGASTAPTRRHRGARIASLRGRLRNKTDRSRAGSMYARGLDECLAARSGTAPCAGTPGARAARARSARPLQRPRRFLGMEAWLTLRKSGLTLRAAACRLRSKLCLRAHCLVDSGVVWHSQRSRSHGRICWCLTSRRIISI